jgi:hypothetical protein
MIWSIEWDSQDSQDEAFEIETSDKRIRLDVKDTVSLYHKLGKILTEHHLSNVESTFWQMLMDLEGHLAKDDVVGREIVKAGYKTWNEMHPDNKPLEPRSLQE